MTLIDQQALDVQVLEEGIARLPIVLPHHIAVRRKVAKENGADRLIFRVNPWYDIWCRANSLHSKGPELLSHVLSSGTENAEFFRRCSNCDDLFRYDMSQREVQDDPLKTLEGWDEISEELSTYGRAKFLDITDRPEVDADLPQLLRRLIEQCRLFVGREDGFRVLVADWLPFEKANCIYIRMVAISCPL